MASGKTKKKSAKAESRCRTGGVSAILAAAEKLFSEHGYDAVSSADIAAEAGVSKANIYHHFTSKRDLYLEVISVCKSDLGPVLQDMAKTPSSFSEGFARIASAHLESILKHSRVTRLVRRSLLDDGKRFGQELAQKIYGGHFGNFVAVLKKAQESGEIRPDVDPAMAALLLVAANTFFFDSQNVFRHFPNVDFADSPEKYSEKVVNIILSGILSDKKKNSLKRKSK